jgi:hypothetical protein
MGLEVKDEFYWDITEMYVPAIQSYIKRIHPKYKIRDIPREELSLTRNSSPLMDDKAEVLGIPNVVLNYTVHYDMGTEDFNIQVRVSLFDRYKCTFMFTMAERLNIFYPAKVFMDRAMTQLDECVCKNGSQEEYKRTKLYKTYRTFFKHNPELVMKALSVNCDLGRARFIAAGDTIG